MNKLPNKIVKRFFSKSGEMGKVRLVEKAGGFVHLAIAIFLMKTKLIL